MTKEEIKQSVKMSEILSRYGLKPNRAGFICCPFHKEKSASCKIYDDSFYCFGCGIGGDVFEFVMQYESVPFSTAFIELGGTYISKKGKSRNQIRHEVRDIKAKMQYSKEKRNPVQDPNELEQVEKNILMYETALKTFPPDSEEWYMYQFDLEKEKSRYEILSAKSGGEKHS